MKMPLNWLVVLVLVDFATSAYLFELPPNFHQTYLCELEYLYKKSEVLPMEGNLGRSTKASTTTYSDIFAFIFKQSDTSTAPPPILTVMSKSIWETKTFSQDFFRAWNILETYDTTAYFKKCNSYGDLNLKLHCIFRFYCRNCNN